MAWSPNWVPGRRSRPAARSRPGTRRSGSRCGSPASPTSRRRPSEGGVSAVTDADLAVVAEQLGREPRGVMAVAARCVCGRPTVVRTAPRLPDGTPFPTTFYLTHPTAVAAISTLEAAGVMQTMTARLAAGPGVNPLGDEALALIAEVWRPDRCTCSEASAGRPDDRAEDGRLCP